MQDAPGRQNGRTKTDTVEQYKSFFEFIDTPARYFTLDLVEVMRGVFGTTTGVVLAAVIVHRLWHLTKDMGWLVEERDGLSAVRLPTGGWYAELQGAWSSKSIKRVMPKLREAGIVVAYGSNPKSYRYALDEGRLLELAGEQDLGHLMERNQRRVHPWLRRAGMRVPAALLLSQIDYLTSMGGPGVEVVDGSIWLKRSVSSWLSPWGGFPFLKEDAVEESLELLEELGLLVRGQFGGFDRSGYYRIVQLNLAGWLWQNEPNEWPEGARAPEAPGRKGGERVQVQQASEVKGPSSGGQTPRVVKGQKPETARGQTPIMFYVEGFEEVKKESSKGAAGDYPVTGSSVAVEKPERNQGKSQHSRIRDQFSSGFLATLYAEAPGRREAWDGLSRTRVEECWQTADQDAAAHPGVKAGTRFIAELDAASGLASLGQKARLKDQVEREALIRQWAIVRRQALDRVSSEAWRRALEFDPNLPEWEEAALHKSVKDAFQFLPSDAELLNAHPDRVSWGPMLALFDQLSTQIIDSVFKARGTRNRAHLEPLSRQGSAAPSGGESRPSEASGVLGGAFD